MSERSTTERAAGGPARAGQAHSREHAAVVAVLAMLPDAGFLLDLAGRITACNAAAVQACGTPADALHAASAMDQLAPDDLEEARQRFALAGTGRPQQWRASLRRRIGAPLPCELLLGAVDLGDGGEGYLLVARDVSRQDALEAQLLERAMHDPLTGLANRARFRERAERALRRSMQRAPHRISGPTTVATVVATEAATTRDATASASSLADAVVRVRQQEDASATAAATAAATGAGDATPASGEAPALGHHVAVLFIDLDDFKTINDSMGHAEGDRLLEEIAARLLKATRGFDVVARLGGDEFGVLLDGMMRVTDAYAVVDRIAGAVRRPVELGTREVVVGASIGVAYGRDAGTVDELLRNADVAMYQAKTAGKGRFAEFDHAMHAAAVARLELAVDLRHAIERGELRLAYQPVVELATGAAVGVEALVRWERRGTLLMPLAFIPLAEETGLIVPMGRWVLQEACRQLAEWRTTLPGGMDLMMNVNVSGRQLTEAGFVMEVIDILGAADVPADRLTLEITETVLVERASDSVAVLHELRRHGVRIAIDDFGTGYSSLGYLQQFPVDVLKIDRAFVERVTQGGSEAALARTIVGLGEALGLAAVAEGIETGAQQAALTALGCLHGQGYHFARPLGVADVEALLRAQRPGQGQ